MDREPSRAAPPLRTDSNGVSAGAAAIAESLLEAALARNVRDHAVFALDASGHVVSWSESARRVEGWSAEEVLGRHVSIFYPEEEASGGGADEALRAAAREGRFEEEGWRLRTDGSRFRARVVIEPLTGEDGALLGFAKVVEDLTESVEAEVLREREERLRLLAEAVDDVLYVSDPVARRVLYVSPSFSRVFGRDPSVVSEDTRRLGELVHPDDRRRVLGALELQAVGEATVLDYRVVLENGTVRWIHDRAFPVPREDGGVYRTVGVASDVTEQRRAEAARAILVEAGRFLSYSLERGEILHGVARLVVPTLADWCWVHVLDESGELVAGDPVHADPVREPLLHELEERFPPHAAFRLGIHTVLESGEPLFFPRLRRDQVLRALRNEEQVELLERIGLRSVLVVPLRARERVIGTITCGIGPDSRRHYEATDLQFAEELAARAGLALENARLYDDALVARAEAEAERGRAVSILESIGDGFIAVRRDGTVAYVNRQAAELVRQPPAELVGRPVREAFPRFRQRAVEEARKRALEEGSPGEVEYYDDVADRWFCVRVYPFRGGVSLFLQDVTERQRRESADRFLAGAGALLASSLDYGETLGRVAELAVRELSGLCLVYLIDGEGDPRLAASAHEGPEAEAALAWVRARDRPGADPPRLLLRVVASGESALLAEAAASPDREADDIAPGVDSVLAVPLVARGERLGALVMAHAGSGRRLGAADLKLAEELGRRTGLAVDNARLYHAAEKARRDAEAASRAKSDFLAVMSHELRTPLNAIVGYGDLLDSGIGGELTGRQRGYVARIRSSSWLLLELIDQILSLSRIEAGMVELEWETVDLAALGSDALELVRPLARDRGLRLRFLPPGRRIEIETDAGKLRQILLNLLSNAVKFTVSGEVALEVSDAGEAEGGEVGLRVRDTGIGIPAGDLERIFEPFVRASGATDGSGTGLGLSVSRRFARLLGGEVTVESTAGEGSVFTVTLPRGRASG